MSNPDPKSKDLPVPESEDRKALKQLQASSDIVKSVLIPQSFGEAMEFAKLMSMTKTVPPHLRGNPGDCLAVLMQAMRWNADPYAVASKSYFVNDRIAYEAQLINAVVLAYAPLEGRLDISYDDDPKRGLACRVVGKIKGDPTPKEVWQEMNTITTKNSPLWKQSPRQQLAYYTVRLWARLYVPDVLLGIYSRDELEDAEPINNLAPATPRPSRIQYIDNAEPAEPDHVVAQSVVNALTEAAERGSEAFTERWIALDVADADALKASGAFDAMKIIAEAADAAGSVSHGTEAEADAGPSDADRKAELIRKLGGLANLGAIEDVWKNYAAWVKELDPLDAADCTNAYEAAKRRATAKKY